MVLSLVVLIWGVSFADAGRGAQFKEMREKVQNACAEELKVSGCEKGKGALKCMRNFYRENKEKTQKISDSCKSAMKEVKELRKKHKNKQSDSNSEEG
jgi:hypothetical protein